MCIYVYNRFTFQLFAGARGRRGPGGVVFLPPLILLIGGFRMGAKDRSAVWSIFFSFSCSFQENLSKILGWRPHLNGGTPSSGKLLQRFVGQGLSL